MADKSGVTLNVLHLDDDIFELERVQNALEKNPIDCNFKVESVDSPEKYLKRLKKKPLPDVVILDVHLGNNTTTGVDMAQVTRKSDENIIILMCSTANEVQTIAECLQTGADDFISKQTDKGELSLRVHNSYKLAKLKQGNSSSVKPGKKDAIIGTTMNRVESRIPRIVDSAITAVYIRGESGTGKEVVADLFSKFLPKDTPFVKVNCGAIVPTLLESELFGHVKGAFTGATADKRGLLESASGGWIFLDEIATLKSSAQVALLRVIENQEVMRVGSTKSKPINVRVISATNEPLEEMVKEGLFRSDLWQRLRETEIHLPPLRERPDEIKALIGHFCKSMTGGPYEVSPLVEEILASALWKDGNVRELRNCLRAMTEMHQDKLLVPLSIPQRIWKEMEESPKETEKAVETAKSTSGAGSVTTEGSLSIQLSDGDTQTYEQLADLLLIELTKNLSKQHGKMSIRSLSQLIGMSRSTLSGKLKALIQKDIIPLAELNNFVGIS